MSRQGVLRCVKPAELQHTMTLHGLFDAILHGTTLCGCIVQKGPVEVIFLERKFSGMPADHQGNHVMIWRPASGAQAPRRGAARATSASCARQTRRPTSGGQPPTTRRPMARPTTRWTRSALLIGSHGVGMGLASRLCSRGSAAEQMKLAWCLLHGSTAAEHVRILNRAPSHCRLPGLLGSACLWGAPVTGGVRAQDVPAQPGARGGLPQHAGPHLRL